MSRSLGEGHLTAGPPASAMSPAFVTTNWSLVLAAGESGEQRGQSLAELCELYWFPLYAFLRRQGSSGHDAEDQLQSFFTWLLDAELLRRADRNRGRFRSFLRVALRQFLAREGRRARARKRSPAQPVVSLDFAEAEWRYCQALADQWTPDRVFEHSWAVTTLEAATNRLRTQYAQAGRLARFEALAPFLASGREADRQRCSAELGLSADAFNMALYRLRRQFGQLLRDEVARTVAVAEEVDDELRVLMAALSAK